MQREKFSSRLGFLLISAGCSIGLGNVYRFPITTGNYGGAIFVLIYIAFLILLGIPAMTAELAVGRASGRSVATSFDVLERPGQKWHLMKYLGMGGNYLLMMFYTVISGWMVIYFIKYLTGSIMAVPADQLGGLFGAAVSDPETGVLATGIVIVACFGVCSLGLRNGVEKVTKVMMIALLVLMVGLAVYSCTLNSAAEGLRFYLVPSFENIESAGLMTVISSAMGQAFFTLSIGIGAIAIFGSYIGKERRLLGETITIVSLDTFVALMSGVIIFPACFTYNNGVTAEAGSVGATFLFTTLSSIFNAMPGGRIVGTLFFLFMIFAALSTVIAVFENIMSFWLELTKLSRAKIAVINIVLMLVLTMPAIFGNSIWSAFEIGGKGIMDLEDFVISNNLLPVGALVYITFCSWNRLGWGWARFIDETNSGKGIKFPKWLGIYCRFILPLIILAVFISGYIK